MKVRWLLDCAALGVLAACGGSGHGGGDSLNPVPAEYQGTWTSGAGCLNNGDGTNLHSITLSVGATTYALAGILCTGGACTHPCENHEERGTLNNAGTMVVDYGIPEHVSALKIDRTPSGKPTFYDLVYLETAPPTGPDRIWLGSRMNGHDGTTPERRPITLDTFIALNRN